MSLGVEAREAGAARGPATAATEPRHYNAAADAASGTTSGVTHISTQQRRIRQAGGSARLARSTTDIHKILIINIQTPLDINR